jgi:hypothetical protein
VLIPIALGVRSGSSERSVATAIGDATELLVVLVDERAGMTGDVAHRSHGHSVGVPEAVEAATDQNPMDCGWRAAEQRAKTIRTISDSGSSFEDLRLDDIRKATR